MNSRVILCINAFGLGNMHFMKTGSDFVPFFLHWGREVTLTTSFLGNLLGKGI